VREGLPGRRRMLQVGLTGGIACGKSSVLARFRQAGFHTLDLDRIAHELMMPDQPAFREVVEAFGGGVLTPEGRIDRGALGRIVFSDVAARERLNAIVHPKVREEEDRRLRALAEPNAIVVSEAALLVEAGMHLRYDRLIVVHCDPEEQLRRLVRRDGIDEATAETRIATQMPLGEKRRFAHIQIDTSGTPLETGRQADEAAGVLRSLRWRAPEFALGLERAAGSLVYGPKDGPRGLDPGKILHEIIRSSGLELAQIARKMLPPSKEPWFRAAHPHEESGPETLMAPLVLWASARGIRDEPYVCGAAFSLGRLTHLENEALAGGCLFALALREVALSGAYAQERVKEWSDLAARWGCSPPPESVTRIVSAVSRFPRDLSAAREASLGFGKNGDLAGALVGLAVGAPASQSQPFLEDLRQLRALALSPDN